MNRKNLLISGFADEIDPSLNRQLEALQKMGIRYIEMRGVDGKSLVHCTDSELSVIHRKLDAAGVRLSSVGSPIGKIGIEDDFAPHWELFQRTVEIAQKLDAPFIRMFSFYPPGGPRGRRLPCACAGSPCPNGRIRKRPKYRVAA